MDQGFSLRHLGQALWAEVESRLLWRFSFTAPFFKSFFVDVAGTHWSPFPRIFPCAVAVTYCSFLVFLRPHQCPLHLLVEWEVQIRWISCQSLIMAIYFPKAEKNFDPESWKTLLIEVPALFLSLFLFLFSFFCALADAFVFSAWWCLLVCALSGDAVKLNLIVVSKLCKWNRG